MKYDSHQLDQLKSTDHKVRIAACKRMRAAPKLSSEAIQSLEVLSIDANPGIARTARNTLRFYRLKLWWVVQALIWGIVGAGVLGILYMVVSLGKVARISCERAGPGAPVNCVEQPSYFYLVPMQERVIRDVLSVEVYSVETDDSILFNIEFTTGTGMTELDSGFSYDPSTKQELVDKLNPFIISNHTGSLALVDSGVLTLGSLFFGCIGPLLAAVVGILVIGGLSRLWERIRPRSRKPVMPVR